MIKRIRDYFVPQAVNILQNSPFPFLPYIQFSAYFSASIFNLYDVCIFIYLSIDLSFIISIYIFIRLSMHIRQFIYPRVYRSTSIQPDLSYIFTFSDDHQFSPLHWAAKHGHIKIVEILIGDVHAQHSVIISWTGHFNIPHRNTVQMYAVFR